MSWLSIASSLKQKEEAIFIVRLTRVEGKGITSKFDAFIIFEK